TQWDTYAPPKPGYCAAYLQQLWPTTSGTLFGWLYHDGQDEFGRSDIPYFAAYYLSQPLAANHLSQILTCLQRGPLEWMDRSTALPSNLNTLVLEHLQDYIPARPGVELPPKLRVESYSAIESQTPLNWFHTESQTETIPIRSSSVSVPTHQPKIEKTIEKAEALISVNTGLGEPIMNANPLEAILQQLVAKPIGIQGAALLSREGQAIVMPIGIDENTAGILAGSMLQLLSSTQAELGWQEIDTVTVRSQAGHLLLKSCNADTYLLIQSGKVPVGLLEGEVNRTAEKLREALDLHQAMDFEPTLTLSAEAFLLTEPIPDPFPQQPNPELEAGVTYRGRRVSS
ncbi:MAG TPA: hypothetical protein V6D19_24330, partial [Stenomitos sp.]